MRSLSMEINRRPACDITAVRSIAGITHTNDQSQQRVEFSLWVTDTVCQNNLRMQSTLRFGCINPATRAVVALAGTMGTAH